MQSKEHYRGDSFVVRIWRECENGCVSWRGWVQHARSGASAPVLNLDELAAFIERHVGRLAAVKRKGLR
ncbi:MAG: hypothetical protein JW850_15280 [Thermoflexales bacterium]|nr:hypothetical protein [Thermoflexales bacterium]